MLNFFLLCCFKVCPILGPTLISRVLSGFVPDEFCPTPVPPEVLRALDSEVGSLFKFV